jgi:hypothetical protein
MRGAIGRTGTTGYVIQGPEAGPVTTVIPDARNVQPAPGSVCRDYDGYPGPIMTAGQFGLRTASRKFPDFHEPRGKRSTDFRDLGRCRFQVSARLAGPVDHQP